MEETDLRSAMDEMAKHKGWSIDFVCKTFGDDLEPEKDHWAVFEVRGNRNDREWTEIGTGATPAAAIINAVANRRPPLTQTERKDK